MSGVLFGENRQENEYDRVETSPFQQTNRFRDDQHGALQDMIFGATKNLFGGMNFGSLGNGGGGGGGSSWGGGGGGGGGGGVGMRGFEHAQAGKFTEEFDPILAKLTEGPMIEKMLAQSIDPLSQRTQRQLEQLDQAAGGARVGGPASTAAKAQTLQAAGQQEAAARAQSYLGALGMANESTNNQVNNITQANMANTSASAQLGAANMAANATVQAAGIGAGASRYATDQQMRANMMQLPLQYASMLNPTFTQGQNFAPVQTSSTQTQKPGLLNIGSGIASSFFGM